VRGKAMLYDYCASHGVNHRRCGKLIVAQNDAEIAQLQIVEQRARANGVHDLQWLSRDEALALEPQLHCTRALLSPSTGIVDSHGLMLALLGDAQAAGAMLALLSPVQRAAATPRGIELEVGGETATTLLADAVVNCAGHGAPVVAAATRGLAPEHVPPELYEQLDEGGRMVIPIGARGHQTLLRVTRVGNEFRREELMPVSFVPFVEGTEA